MSERRRRWAVALSVVGVVVAGSVVDATVARPSPPTATMPSVTAVAAPVAESSVWYCAGGTGASGTAPAAIVLTNTSDRPVGGMLDVVTTGTATGRRALTVPSRGTLTVEPDGVADGDWVAATVNLEGGGVVASESVSGSAGWSITPCASGTATDWYFAHASTRGGDSAELLLYNPTATTADVDVTMATSLSGYLQPSDYQELTVAPDELTALDLGDHAQNDPAVATDVAALSGAVVADQLQIFGTSGQTGAAVQLGTAAAATRSVFPQSTDATGTSVTFHLFNPSNTGCRVTVAFGLPEDQIVRQTVSVPALAAVALSTAGQLRIPDGVAYSTTFTTASGKGVVVSRQVVSSSAAGPDAGESTAPSTASARWVVSPPPATEGGTGRVAVMDLSSGPVTVTVGSVAGTNVWMRAGRAQVAGAAGARRVDVRPGAPLDLSAPSLAGGALVVVASGPVAVEVDGAPSASPGVVVLPAYALG